RRRDARHRRTAAIARCRAGSSLRPPAAAGCAGACARRVTRRATGSFCRSRTGRAQLQGDGRRKRREHKYAALTQAICRTASEGTFARHLRNLRKHEGQNMRPRRKKLLWIVPAAIAGMALFVFIGGQVVMRLWNWLLPPLFGWHQIAFWQALGLLVLCRI